MERGKVSYVGGVVVWMRGCGGDEGVSGGCG